LDEAQDMPVTDRRPHLTLVVPTYNERGHLEDLASQLFAATDAAGVALELVIVDDNSPDGTGAIADQLAAVRRVKVIHRAGKLGLGSAVVEGIRVAEADVVGVIDADFSHPPPLVPRMYAAFVATGADMLVASRYVQGGGTIGWPVGRRIMSRVACWLARPLTPIRDAVSGFFMIRRELAERTVVKAEGFKIGLELLVRARPARLVELPFQFANRKAGKSKMGSHETVKYLVQLRDLYWMHLTGPRPAGRSYRLVSPGEVETFAATGSLGASK
jgi:dolichol-phosphate mannosyltransferase